MANSKGHHDQNAVFTVDFKNIALLYHAEIFLFT